MAGSLSGDRRPWPPPCSEIKGGGISSSDEIRLDGDSPFTDTYSHPAIPGAPPRHPRRSHARGHPHALRGAAASPPPTLEDSEASSPRPPAPVSTRSPNGRQLELSPLLRVIQGTGRVSWDAARFPKGPPQVPVTESHGHMSDLPSLAETYLQDLQSLETCGLLPAMSPAT